MSSIIHSVGNLLIPGSEAMAKWNSKSGGYIANPENQGYNNAAGTYQDTINQTTGKQGYKSAKDTGTKDGSEMYHNAYNNARNQTAGIAEQITNKQTGGANAQALKQAQSSGMTRGQAALMAQQSGADTYANNYANNYNTQLAQQNNLMNTNLGQQNNMMNAYNQAQANQLNAQGTLMGSQLTNDQSQYQQKWNNYAQGSKMNAGAGVLDIFSDKKTKDSVKVGLGNGGDLRMEHYKRCGEKLKNMNPNKWKELHWEGK